jgi:hypothetical protein
MKFFKNIKSFFRSKYYALYELITLRLMLRVNNMVRKLIISKGKDPDYVAPPPPPPTPPAPTFGRNSEHARGYTGCSVTSGYSMANGKNWVKKPWEHPIIKSRQAYEAKKFSPVEEIADEPLQVAASTAPQASLILDKIVRVREMCQEMISKGLLQDTPQAIFDQSIEIEKWNDEAFVAFSRVLAKHSVIAKE